MWLGRMMPVTKRVNVRVGPVSTDRNEEREKPHLEKEFIIWGCSWHIDKRANAFFLSIFPCKLYSWP